MERSNFRRFFSIYEKKEFYGGSFANVKLDNKEVSWDYFT